ncbi:MAG: AbrB family transcriptional regulator [Pseudomonadota bacterium]|nr:AbrB family transcriptional regulator [Pseudomonadota bacterium]
MSWRRFQIGQQEIHTVTAAATFALGGAGGALATFAGLPLPMLLGSVLAVGVASWLGLRPGGRDPGVPMGLRLFFVPIIGVSIGNAFTPQVFAEALNWWPTLLAAFVYIPLAHYVGYRGYRDLGRLDPCTAYYSAVPGGLLEVILMGEEAGADRQMLTVLQFMRLILCIMLVPVGFQLFEGMAVGSSAGASLARPDAALGAVDVAVLAAAGVAGFFIGRRLNFPAGIITGPILVSGLVHLAGLTAAAPPDWSIQLTQLIIGTTLGTRFVGVKTRLLVRALRLARVNILFTLALAIGAALLLAGAVDEIPEAVVLAFAPGGLAEMSLIAVSLQISVIYVTSHHILRIVLSVAVAKVFAGRIPPGPNLPKGAA